MPRIAPKPAHFEDSRSRDSTPLPQAGTVDVVDAAIELLTSLLGYAPIGPSNSQAKATGPTLVEDLPCKRRGGVSWTDWQQRGEAARLCSSCPVAHACLLEALRLDAAHRRGEDHYGISGVWSGVWFEPSQLPNSVLRPVDRAPRGRRRTAGSQAHG